MINKKQIDSLNLRREKIVHLPNEWMSSVSEWPDIPASIDQFVSRLNSTVVLFNQDAISLMHLIMLDVPLMFLYFPHCV